MGNKDRSSPKPSGIGLLQETSLHAALKAWYMHQGDQVEVPVGGFVVDIVRGELLIEIQTRHFSSLRQKLIRLTQRHPVRLVYPVPQEKWIVRLAADGLTPISRRKSPKRGRVEHLFLELVRFPQLVTQPNFSVEVLLTREEEVWQDDKRGSWRRKGWSIADRRLVNIVASILLESPSDFLALLPPELPNPFTTLDLARALNQPRYLAQKMAYCLRAMGTVEVVGKQGNAWLYQIGGG
jgi:hypothetical protein